MGTRVWCQSQRCIAKPRYTSKMMYGDCVDMVEIGLVWTTAVKAPIATESVKKAGEYRTTTSFKDWDLGTTHRKPTL